MYAAARPPRVCDFKHPEFATDGDLWGGKHGVEAVSRRPGAARAMRGGEREAKLYVHGLACGAAHCDALPPLPPWRTGQLHPCANMNVNASVCDMNRQLLKCACGLCAAAWHGPQGSRSCTGAWRPSTANGSTCGRAWRTATSNPTSSCSATGCACALAHGLARRCASAQAAAIARARALLIA